MDVNCRSKRSGNSRLEKGAFGGRRNHVRRDGRGGNPCRESPYTPKSVATPRHVNGLERSPGARRSDVARRGIIAAAAEHTAQRSPAASVTQRDALHSLLHLEYEFRFLESVCNPVVVR
jgi:hypothetical protein